MKKVIKMNKKNIEKTITIGIVSMFLFISCVGFTAAGMKNNNEACSVENVNIKLCGNTVFFYGKVKSLGRGIPGVSVHYEVNSILGWHSVEDTTTDINGNFEIEIEVPSYTATGYLTLTKSGYKDLSDSFAQSPDHNWGEGNPIIYRLEKEDSDSHSLSMILFRYIFIKSPMLSQLFKIKN